MVNFCRDNQDDINIADVCLQTAIQLEKNSKTLLSSMIGLAMQEIHYKHNYQTDLLEQVAKKRKSYEQNFSKNRNQFTLSTLMFTDEQLSRVWLDSGLEKGEWFANNQAMKELIVLAQNENYRPCERYVNEIN